MNYQTSEQLSELRLNVMHQEYARQEELPVMNDLPYDERLSVTSKRLLSQCCLTANGS